MIFVLTESTRPVDSKWAPRGAVEAQETLQVQNLGINISGLAYARINLRPDSKSAFHFEPELF